MAYSDRATQRRGYSGSDAAVPHGVLRNDRSMHRKTYVRRRFPFRRNRNRPLGGDLRRDRFGYSLNGDRQEAVITVWLPRESGAQARQHGLSEAAAVRDRGRRGLLMVMARDQREKRGEEFGEKRSRDSAVVF